MNKPKKYYNANKAWVKVSDRLEAEGLIDIAPSVVSRSAYFPLLKFAAALVVVAATAAMVFLFTGKNQTETFVVSNMIDNQTLVKTLDDGSVVFLANNSTLSFTDEYNKSSRTLTLEGEAFFEVASNTKLPFIVELENSSVEVIGTSFVLRNLPGQDVELFVESGKVGFLPLKDYDKSIVVEKGQRLVFDGTHFEKSFSGLDYKWRNNHLHFGNEELSNIISVINKNFAVNITIDDKALAKRQLTVTFKNNTVDEMVSIICEYYNLEAKLLDENAIVLTKK